MTVRQTVKCTKNNKKNLKILTKSLECTTIFLCYDLCHRVIWLFVVFF